MGQLSVSDGSTSSIPRIGAGNVSNENVSWSGRQDNKSVNGSSDESSRSKESPSSRPDSDLRDAMYQYERSNFSSGDEQTVNACLIALLIPLFLHMGRVSCVRHDRTALKVFRTEHEELYIACVDGVILQNPRPQQSRIQSFIEVKANLRGENQAVRRQISAQMAAFIYRQNGEKPPRKV